MESNDVLVSWYKAVKHAQKQVALLIPRVSFARLIQELVQEVSRGPMRMQASALAALQYAAETMLIIWFEML